MSGPRSWGAASSVRRPGGRGGMTHGTVGGATSPPFHKPVFVVTHHSRKPLSLSDTTYTFVTDGIEAALAQARTAAAGKDVFVGGGADIINQFLVAGLLDELELHVVPILLGGGARLFDGVGPDRKLEALRTIDAPGVAHLKYRVVT